MNPRSRRIRESRKGRPCNELGSQPTVYRRPARTFVLPAPRVQDGLTISPSPFRKQADSKARTDHVPDNGQVERMNRTIKDATVKRYHYDSHDQLVRHLDDFVAAYNFARRLKTLNGLTPYEFICKRWTIEPERFSLNPLQQMPGLNMLLRRRRHSYFYLLPDPRFNLRVAGIAASKSFASIQSRFSSAGKRRHARRLVRGWTAN